MLIRGHFLWSTNQRNLRGLSHLKEKPLAFLLVIVLSVESNLSVGIAQEGPPPDTRSSEITLHASSNLVLVDVIATRNSLPDSTLKQNDFRIFDNNRLVPIKTFDTGVSARPLALWFVVLCNMQGYEKRDREAEQTVVSFSSETMTGLANWHRPRERMVFIIAAAGGLRIGEVLGIEIDKHLSADCATITISQKARHCKVENRLKTASAFRQVDLHPDVAHLLKEFIGTRASGFLFQTRNGKPLSSSNIIKRHLHPALKELGYVNPLKGTHKAGNHAFRRFRNTYLQKSDCMPKRTS